MPSFIQLPTTPLFGLFTQMFFLYNVGQLKYVNNALIAEHLNPWGGVSFVSM